MKIYEAIQERIDAGEYPVRVTCLSFGKLMCQALLNTDFTNYPINCIDIKNFEVYTYSEYGEYVRYKGQPQLALGHFDSQLETAQAIKEQNYDTE